MEEIELDYNIRLVRFAGDLSTVHVVQDRGYAVINTSDFSIVKGNIPQQTYDTVRLWLELNIKE